MNLLTNCTICPRKCGVNRYLEKGFCGATNKLRVAYYSLHMWEEPIISGDNGSGTIFFSNCNLRCLYCQNKKISIDGYGNKEFNNASTEKYAYPIESVYEINKPIKLDILKQEFNFTAPQSFTYGEKYQKLLEYIDKVGTTKLY